jgi:hypothetical protein
LLGPAKHRLLARTILLEIAAVTAAQAWFKVGVGALALIEARISHVADR